jgi:hypothetical protein
MRVRGLDSFDSRQRLVMGSCKHDSGPLGSVKGWTFLTSCMNISFLRRIPFHEC